MVLPEPDDDAVPEPSSNSFSADIPHGGTWGEKVKTSGPRKYTDQVRNPAGNIYLIRGKDCTGRAAWYYLQVKPAYKRKFEKDVKTGNVTLTDYGVILESGYGGGIL